MDVIVMAVMGVFLALLSPLAGSAQAQAQVAYPAGGYATAQATPLTPSLPGLIPAQIDGGGGDDEDDEADVDLDSLFGDQDVFGEFCEEGQSPAECADQFDVGELVDMAACIGDGNIMGCINNALGEEDSADEAANRPETNYSLYSLSSANTAFLFDALGMSVDTAGADGVEEDDEVEEVDNVVADVDGASGMPGQWADRIQHPANAGAFLGFCDTDVTPGMCTKYYGSYTTKNTTSYSYDTFRVHAQNNDDTGRAAAGVYAYALFGATTSGLGLTELISTSSASSGQINPERMFMGNIMLFAFAVSGSIDAFFGMIIDALSAINPFRLFFDAVREADVSDGYDIANEGTEGPLEGLAGFISTMYNGLVNMGWLVTIPIFIGVFAMGALMLRRYDTGSNLKRLVVRIFFLSLGFILLGSTYTATLESFQGYGTDTGSVNSSKVVLNTYLDYDAWVNNTRMAIPNDNQAEIVWDVENQTPTDKSVSRVRMTTFNINTMANNSFRSIADSDNRQIDDMGFVGAAMNDEDDSSNPIHVFSETWSMLNRYVEGDVVTGEGFEGRAKAGLDEVVLQAGTMGDAAQQHQFTAYTDVGVMKAMEPQEVNQYALAFVDNSRGLHSPQLEGGAAGISEADEVQLMSKDGAITLCQPGEVGTVTSTDGGRLAPIRCNMSVLSQYNFLNTNFDSLGASVQSPERTDNTHARQSHAAVSQIGGGMMGLLYWFSALSILGSFIVIGIFYALSMLFSNIKRSIQLIAAVPFATLGFMGGIAKVIIYTVAMLVEIILTLFVYRVMQELILAIPAILEAPLVTAFGGDYGGETMGIVATGLGALFNQNAVAATILITLVATSGIIIFTIVAVKLRGTLISAIDEAVTNGVNKLLDTSVGGGGSSGQGAALRRSLGTAGAMALGHRIASGGQDDAEAMPDSGTGTTGGGGTGDGDDPDGGGGFSNAAYTAGVGTGANEMFGGGTAMDAEGGANGVQFDENGNPVDGQGNPLGRDADGNYTDQNGNAVYDAAGNPIDPAATGKESGGSFIPASMAGAAAGAGLTDFGNEASATEVQGAAGADDTVGEGIGVTGQSGEELQNAGGQEIGDSGVYQMPDGSLVAAGDSQAAQAMGEASSTGDEVGISSATGAQLEAAGATEIGEGSGLYQTPNGEVVAAADSDIAASQREAQASDIDSALAGSDGHIGKSSMTGAQLAAAGAEEISKGSGLYDTGGGAVVAASDSAVGQSLGENAGQAQLAGASAEQLEAAGATELGNSGLYETSDGAIVAANDTESGQALVGSAAAGAAGGIAASGMSSNELAASGATEVGESGSGVYQNADGSLVAASDSAAGQALGERGEMAAENSGQALVSNQTGEQLAASGATEIGNSGLYQTPDGAMVAASDSSMAANAGLAGATSDVPTSSMTGGQLTASGATEIGDSGVYQTQDGDLVAAADSEAAQLGAQAVEYGQTSGEQAVGSMTGAAQAGVSPMGAAAAGSTAANMANAIAGEQDHAAGAPDPTDAKATAQAGFSALGDALHAAPAAMGQMKENLAEEMNITPTAGSEPLSAGSGQLDTNAMAGAGVAVGGASMAAIAAQAARNRQQGMSATEAMQAAAQQLNGGQGPDAGVAAAGTTPPTGPTSGDGSGGAHVTQAGHTTGGQAQQGQYMGPLTGGHQPVNNMGAQSGQPAAANQPTNNTGQPVQPGVQQSQDQRFVQASNEQPQTVQPVANSQSADNSDGNSAAGMMGMMLASQAAQQAMRPSAPERSINQSVNGGRRGGSSASGAGQRPGGGTAGAMINAGMRGAMRGGMTNPMMMGMMAGQNTEGGGVTPAPQTPAQPGQQGGVGPASTQNAGYRPGERPGERPGATDREDRLRESKERRELTEEMRKAREDREAANARGDDEGGRTTGRGPSDNGGGVQV